MIILIFYYYKALIFSIFVPVVATMSAVEQISRKRARSTILDDTKQTLTSDEKRCLSSKVSFWSNPEYYTWQRAHILMGGDLIYDTVGYTECLGCCCDRV